MCQAQLRGREGSGCVDTERHGNILPTILERAGRFGAGARADKPHESALCRAAVVLAPPAPGPGAEAAFSHLQWREPRVWHSPPRHHLPQEDPVAKHVALVVVCLVGNHLG